ncbi:ATP-binding protein [Actinoplanes auranticolor]|uniref:LuxR family transcriptional regulator n=1 Tax=Actinoplanes auranticolor TaxID=47988 RepID=A0A919W1G0_9ACTN|nr:helix-turn-helix transcriptional regulator [Actinoplanes auranticolor]GIM76468.1 LuxR family transcriptional regulator [Actinoplanes auranticolor]
MLTGRRVERDVLERLIEAVRGGQGRALVVRGDAGVGKTALLDYLADQTSRAECRLVRVAGVQSEMELAFAGLYQLCAPLLDRAEQLPVPQRDALRTAFGLVEGPPPDRFHIGLAVLSLLSAAGGDRPVVCLVDDEQWLDEGSAQVLGFIARRLLADPVGLVFGAREPGAELAGLPELQIDGLADDEARALLDSALTGPLDGRVRDLLVAEARGNPLALLELPRGMSPDELAGGFGLPGAMPLAGRIEDSFLRQLAVMPIATRQLMLLAAADPSGDPSLVWRAADLLDLPKDAGEPAVEAGLAEFGTHVRFRHPLLRSAIYRSAAQTEQRAVHAVLAEATDVVVDPDRRAWHRAQAAVGLDERIAVELEASAGRAQARGGLAAAAAFRERAALLTPDPGRRASRLLTAARAKRDAEAFAAAAQLLDAARAGPLTPLETAGAERLRGQIAGSLGQNRNAGQLLLGAARLFEPLSADLARETHLEALWEIAMWTGDREGLRRDAALAARAAPSAPEPSRAVDDLLDALALRFTEGFTAAVPAMSRALDSLLAMDIGSEAARHLLWSGARPAGCLLTMELSDMHAWQVLTARNVQLARDVGALVPLELGLHHRALFHIHQGELDTAARLLAENDLIRMMTGRLMGAVTGMLLAAWRGDETRAGELIQALTHEVSTRDTEVLVAYAMLAGAVLNNGLGRYELARDCARQAFELDVFGSEPLVVPELLEAASRTGDLGLAGVAVEWLSERASSAPTDWAVGMAARGRALLSEGDAAEAGYRESIECLVRAGFGAQVARAHLLYGEWLRRQNRRSDARVQLRTAYEKLTAMGAEGFAERARQELSAAGETARKRSVGTVTTLTAQEALIAQLARDGHTNLEIAGRLFLSARTVQYHLRKVFTKLGINSRRELRAALPPAVG